MLEKYGTDNTMAIEQFKQQQKETVQERYGVENVSQVEEFKRK